MGQLEDILVDAARTLEIDLAPGMAGTLARYAGRVTQWNRKANLTGARDAATFCRSFLTDALAVAPFVEGRRIADIGSGNGLPGVVLAVLKPEAEVWLIEPRARRARFLQQVRIELSLTNVRVVVARVEDWHPTDRPNSIVAQAVGDLGFLLSVTKHLHGPGCRLHALKGRAPEAELAALGPAAAACSVRRLEVPGWEDRHLVTVDCDDLPNS